MKISGTTMRQAARVTDSRRAAVPLPWMFMLALPISQPAAAVQYVMAMTDTAYPAVASFGNDTLLEDDGFYPASGQGVDIGFAFPFYCATYNRIYVNPNGFTTLGAQVGYGAMGWAGANTFYAKEATIGVCSGGASPDGSCEGQATPYQEYFPHDTDVAGKQLRYLLDTDSDNIADDGVASA